MNPYEAVVKALMIIYGSLGLGILLGFMVTKITK